MGGGNSSGSVSAIPLLAQRCPGELLAGAMSRIRERVAAIHGEAAVHADGRRLMPFYHGVLLRPTLQTELKHSTDREMRTLACAIDSLNEGDLARCGDVLISRYKALEEAARTGSLDLA